MKTALKNIFSFILLATVLIVVPWWIETDWTIPSKINLILGITVGGIGLTVMFFTISSFIRIGKGTLAPWTPTKKLVVVGLYRYVRNPMILGVFAVLLGEATVFSSLQILEWAGVFFLINTTYFILSEEPGLERRFGGDYIEYKKQVGRWIPRLTPYNPEARKTEKKGAVS
jgi:protein-S-isoprenylcysteine O-methyltransferase Ste14